jgi:hypothetical protein
VKKLNLECMNCNLVSTRRQLRGQRAAAAPLRCGAPLPAPCVLATALCWPPGHPGRAHAARWPRSSTRPGRRAPAPAAAAATRGSSRGRRAPPRGLCPQDEVIRETHTMKQYHHPNVLRLYTSFVNGQDLWMVMPYISGGSVLHIMKYAFPQVGAQAAPAAAGAAHQGRSAPCRARSGGAPGCRERVPRASACRRPGRAGGRAGARPRACDEQRDAWNRAALDAAGADACLCLRPRACRAWRRWPSPPSCARCSRGWSTCTSRAASTATSRCGGGGAVWTRGGALLAALLLAPLAAACSGSCCAVRRPVHPTHRRRHRLTTLAACPLSRSPPRQAGNILVDRDGNVKIGDFGVSASATDRGGSWGNDNRARMTFVGTPCWMAPEVRQAPGCSARRSRKLGAPARPRGAPEPGRPLTPAPARLAARRRSWSRLRATTARPTSGPLASRCWSWRTGTRPLPSSRP